MNIRFGNADLINSHLESQDSLRFSSMYSMIEQKGMTLNNDFGYSFSLFSCLLKKEGRRKGE